MFIINSNLFVSALIALAVSTVDASPNALRSLSTVEENTRELQSQEAFYIIAAPSGERFARLDGGLNKNKAPTKYGIEFESVDPSVKSVIFSLDGDDNFRTESASPWTLFGDETNTGIFNSGKLTNSQHSITATTYSRRGGQGNVIGTHTLDFLVREFPTIESYSFVDTVTGQKVEFDNLLTGSRVTEFTTALIEFDSVAEMNDYAVVANMIGNGDIGSVVFNTFDQASPYIQPIVRTENIAPYTLNGDNTFAANGVYRPFNSKSPAGNQPTFHGINGKVYKNANAKGRLFSQTPGGIIATTANPCALDDNTDFCATIPDDLACSSVLVVRTLCPHFCGACDTA